MSLFPNDSSAHLPRTYTIFRPMAGIEGLRQVRDPAGRLMVSAYPYALAKGLAPIFAGVAGCYILSDHSKAYIGESKDMEQRGAQHAADPSKDFAREVYLIHAQDAVSLDRSARLFLQHRLIVLAEDARLVAVNNVASAQMLPWSDEERATYDRFVADALRLLFDAGCRAFHSNFASQLPPQSVVAPDVTCSEEEEKLEINVPAAPPHGEEVELCYCGLFARGFYDEKGFVVMAGAELRNRINESTRNNISELRRELVDAEVLGRIPGLHDRSRLLVSVRFFSAAVAAKVLTGAHVAATKWVRASSSQPSAD
jgi:hypothetical protein